MMPPSAPRVLFLCSGNYYRSRFAELLFNHLAERAGIPHRADSAGLEIECRTRNPGPLSPHTIQGLRERGIPVPSTVRAPRDVSSSDFANATLVIALKDAEHRPLMMKHFPDLCAGVEFWQIDDVADAPPSV